MTKATHDGIAYRVGSGNVFRDLAIDSPEEELSKARLAIQIHDRVKALGLNVTKAARRLGIPQPKASRLLRGHADGFSVEKMLAFLSKLGQDVRIVVSDAGGEDGCGKFVIVRARPAGARRRRARRPGAAGGRRT